MSHGMLLLIFGMCILPSRTQVAWAACSDGDAKCIGVNPAQVPKPVVSPGEVIPNPAPAQSTLLQIHEDSENSFSEERPFLRGPSFVTESVPSYVNSSFNPKLEAFAAYRYAANSLTAFFRVLVQSPEVLGEKQSESAASKLAEIQQVSEHLNMYQKARQFGQIADDQVEQFIQDIRNLLVSHDENNLLVNGHAVESTNLAFAEVETSLLRSLQKQQEEGAKTLSARNAASTIFRAQVSANPRIRIIEENIGTIPTLPAAVGGYFSSHEECLRVTRKAIEVGYRHFDTSQRYINCIGEVLAEVSINRAEFFITGKLDWVTIEDLVGNVKDEQAHLQVEDAVSLFEEFIRAETERLNVQYFDVYMLHYDPDDGNSPYIHAYKAMERLYRGSSRLVRYLGASNFSPSRFRALCQEATVTPLYWQNQCTLYQCMDFEALALIAEYGIYYAGFGMLSPTGEILNPLKDPYVQHALHIVRTNQQTAALAEKMPLSAAGLLLLWARCSLGVFPIVSAGNAKHLAANLRLLIEANNVLEGSGTIAWAEEAFQRLNLISYLYRARAL